MDTHLSNDVATTPDSHYHNWQPIDGWRARYRCRDCRAVGYKPRLVTMDVEGGPYGGMRITPYVCAFAREGLRCGCPAVKKLRGSWKCPTHVCRGLPIHTTAARAHLSGTSSNDPPGNPSDAEERSVGRVSAET
jgi:hypothetical protein